MAKAKSTKETKAEVPVEEKVEVTKDVLEKMFQEAKKEALAEFKEELEAEKERQMTAAQRRSMLNGVVPETEEQKAWAEERVRAIIPLDANEPDEINLTINGETIQVLRGYEVEIPRKYKLVLDNMIEQKMASKKYQKEIQNQVTYVE